MNDDILFMIYDNDKTHEYSYGKRGDSINGAGNFPRGGERFKTPREIVRDHFGSNFWTAYKMYKESFEKLENK